MKFFLVSGIILCSLTVQAGENKVWENDKIERGRRLVKISGCNDCHTPMYGQMNGDVPEKDWLIGSEIGFRGPWGTTYPTNLRLTVAAYQEKSFVSYIRQKKYLPPMPGFVFKHMTDEEIASIHAYIKHLGVAGKKAPLNLPPNQKSKNPFIVFVPQFDK